MNKFEIFVSGRKGTLSGWDLFKVTGKDRENFFQGQTTNDLLSLEENCFALNARVERNGKIQFFFINIKTSEELFFLIPSDVSEEAVEELSKFIIMDDVEIFSDDRQLSFTIGGNKKSGDCFTGFLFGLPASLSFGSAGDEYTELSQQEETQLKIESGWPSWKRDIQKGELINNTRLNDLAVSYTKGCYLGQETVAKIENGRGASFYPSLIRSNQPIDLSEGPFEINGRKGGELLLKIDNLAMVKLFREFRIENKEFEIIQNGNSYSFSFINYKKELTNESFAHELYLDAVKKFQEGDEQYAIRALSVVIELSPAFSDAYESLGVIYGRQEKFEKGIELMDKLLEVNNDSVMAHTNKSLYLMRLGKIDEAEEEKGLATVKSFAEFGKVAKEKKIKEKLDKEKEQEITQRESMFKQVLEIDSEDTIANFGMADVYYFRKEYKNAKEHLLKVISVDEKYSMAYSLLGKTLEVLGEKDEAREIYIKGIEVASSKGELMPANEMQARLVKL